MHICHVNLASGFAGGERQTVNLIRYLADKGISQTLVAKPGNQMIEELAEIPVTVRLASHFLLGHAGGSWDLVHCHDGKGVYWGLIENLMRRTPYVVTRRVQNPLKNKRVTRAAYGRSRAVICLSRAVREVVQGLLPEQNCPVIPSSFSGFPADPDAVTSIRTRYGKGLVVGQVGSLLRIKGHHTTIEAARILEQMRSDLTFVFVGKGPELESLERQASGLSAVELVGHQSDIGSWLAAMDILVFPSLQEGLGSTVLEAMQHRTPVIGSNIGGIPDMIQHHRNGVLIESEDSAALASAINKLADDPQLRDQLAAQAITDLRRFSPEAVGAAYLELYHQVLG